MSIKSCGRAALRFISRRVSKETTAADTPGTDFQLRGDEQFFSEVERFVNKDINRRPAMLVAPEF